MKEWVITDYEYRRWFTLYNNSLKDFEHELVIHIVREEGVATSDFIESTLYIGDRCMEDYSDILFTKEDGTPLKHELHGEGYFTVKFIFDKEGENKFYVYYGKINQYSEGE